MIIQEDGSSRHQSMMMESDVTGEVRLGFKEKTHSEKPLFEKWSLQTCSERCPYGKY